MVTDTGLSEDAQTLHFRTLDLFMSAPSATVEDRLSSVVRVTEQADAASTDDWDGDGGRAVQQSTLRNAIRFLFALPDTIPAPDVLVDRDGEIVFDWDYAPNRIFSVAVGRDGTLTYSGLFGSARSRGTENLAQGLPASIVESIERVRDARWC